MKLVVDENIPLAQECFGSLGSLVRVAGRTLNREMVRDADALIVRSVTQVNAELLQGSSVKFVGTATIGTDHIDTAYLAQQGTAFASAPGCNARAVAEYVVASLLELERSRNLALKGKTLAIIGLGNVGSALRPLAGLLGLNVICCDPPLAEKGHAGLVEPDEAWAADIVSLHVPYTKQGPYPTHYLGNVERLRNMKSGAVLINTCRGAVVDNRAFSTLLEQRFDLAAVFDVWEDEPNINRELLARVDFASPHVAGYSYDGKVQGTLQIYQALCQHLNIKPRDIKSEWVQKNPGPCLDFSGDRVVKPISALDVVRKVYDIREDDLALRTCMALPRERRAAGFDELRRNYRVRRECASVTIRDRRFMETVMPAEQLKFIQGLGISFS